VRRYFLRFKEDPVWSQILIFALILFFLRLSDSIIAYWAPNQIQSSLGNSVLMGALISFQSVIGFIADLLFPRILRKVRTRRLIILAIITSALTIFFLGASEVKPFVAMFLVTMTLWGIYYELANFANFQFMGSVVPRNIRTAAWGFTGMFVSLAWFFGPFIATELLEHGVTITVGTLIIFLLIAFVLVMLNKSMHSTPQDIISLEKADPWLEFRHWMILAKAVWPALIINLLLGIIDATFYTVGAVWAEKLTHISPWGVWFLPMYLLPFVCLGIPLSTWKIGNGKKKMAEKLLVVSGILFIGMAVSPSISWQLAIICLASCGVAICYPLIEGVFTDYLNRMGKEKKDMIGLTSSVINISYIIWPVFAGLLASKVGERLTFSYMGVLVLTISIILLFVTPRKLKLPQTEIKTWE